MDRRSALIAGIAVVIAIVVAFWAFSPAADAPAGVPEGLTEAADPATLEMLLSIDRISIATSTNYVGHRVYLVRGILKNISDKPIRLVDAKMSFVDYENNPVQESVHQVFNPKWTPLEPGTEYRFEVAFENMPRTWNHRIPNIELTKAAY
jgi:hypothetical protein